MNIPILLLVSILTTLPYEAFAVTAKTPTSFASLVTIVTEMIGTLVVVIFALTFLVFVWGILKNWVIKGTSDEGVENGKKVVTATIIGFVVMLSIWGILALLQSSIFG